MTWVMNVGALRPRLSDISGVITCRAYEEEEDDEEEEEEEEDNYDDGDMVFVHCAISGEITAEETTPIYEDYGG